MSEPLSCIVIEDEPLAQSVLKKYISEHPLLTLVAVCSDAMEAQAILTGKKVELIFLDINLPRLSGINFLKTLSVPPMVIFTTAYSEFAVEGFELNALDYLLKPFSFERFLKAVNKAFPKQGNQQEQVESPQTDKYIFLKADKKVYKVDFENILYAEATGDYVKVITSDSQYLINNTLKNFLGDLPAKDFIRVHKSYIIARSKVKFVEGNYIKTGNADIPIGAAYRDEVLAWLNERKR
jgi:DNA-binding LytR/AlgR family response regulator